MTSERYIPETQGTPVTFPGRERIHQTTPLWSSPDAEVGPALMESPKICLNMLQVVTPWYILVGGNVGNDGTQNTLPNYFGLLVTTEHPPPSINRAVSVGPPMKTDNPQQQLQAIGANSPKHLEINLEASTLNLSDCFYTLRVRTCGDPESVVGGYAVVGIVLKQLCLSEYPLKTYSALFVCKTGRSPNIIKDKFRNTMSALQGVDRLSASESQLGDRHGLDSLFEDSRFNCMINTDCLHTALKSKMSISSRHVISFNSTRTTYPN
ncbi:hypothetical protein T265_06646 [Opisthorchis viverrini]|uniref:Uncharacterized protein n=1 Tax=Opisthorchis viverrini TaxID=6198 RepID=A0A074ZFF3_OPIVI|nr:hypothetical protein T265_06646 [Opisthorchis viverrini]KER26011.1 hypothetical protein T265_06646 [Opisthorchis viverrini]